MCRMLLIGVLAVGPAGHAQTDMPKPVYNFSLTREEKIKLAESAAPPEISAHATLYLLEKTGYVRTREGTNGFSCFVDRQTPLNQEPTCFDAEGSSATLPTRLYVEEQRAKRKSEEQIKAEIDAGYKGGKYIRRQLNPALYICCPITFTFWFPAPARWLSSTAPDVLCSLCDRERHRLTTRCSEHAPSHKTRTARRLHHCLSSARRPRRSLVVRNSVPSHSI